MPRVMARHDAISRAAVERNQGTIVKMTGDGVHAAFDRPIDALIATLEIQKQLSQKQAADGLPLPLRCGLHAGVDERRDGDFYGRAVNRAARIMCAAHGGQMLMSKVVAEQVGGMLPDGATLRDLGTVRLRDLSGPEHIFQLVHPNLRADFPALRSLEGTPNNLTQQLNSFVGRERELTEIKEMLASNRLVTLLGMGGIGKSRLSMQLAAEVLDDFPDGVWFVELAALTDPSLVAQAVASTLGVKEEAGGSVIDALTKYVRDLKLLIILDNCEQVVHGCADISKRLLQAGTQVKILTSSRDYLQVAGETVYHVPTLSVPEAQERVVVESLMQHEAVRLFIDRASAVRRDFGFNERNAAAVIDICRRLDGIPLAIELAAARVRALSVETIASRLSDRFSLLVTGDQTVLPRQRTLRALIDWSHDLLTDVEKILFQRLSVFAGGWTLEAAEAVCADERLPESNVLDLLTRLVEKSLVVLDVYGRYRMLDTVRHYAQEKLEKGVEDAAVRERHFNFYLTFAEAMRAQIGSSNHEIALVRFDAENENVLSAYQWVDSPERFSEKGLRLAAALRGYLFSRGHLTRALEVAVNALSHVNARQWLSARCRALFDAGQLCSFMGRYADARNYLEEALTTARETEDGSQLASVLRALGVTEMGLGDLVKASAYAEEAVALARKLNSPLKLATALNSLAQLHRMQSRLELAEPLYEEYLALVHKLADQELIAIGFLNLAMVSIQKAQGDRARTMLNTAVAIAIQIGLRPIGQSALEVVAGLCAFEAEWENAARFLGAAEAQAQRAALHRDATDEAFLAPLITRAKSALTPTAFKSCVGEGSLWNYEKAMQSAQHWLREKQPAMNH